ncbi:hypothetical protein EK21DRAFT_95045 [Setomelanomma holmii]|uniref:Uncharacterized protein n=1 Tax=Setomelanomma holmii TaxID=210430 RepID=A0A9P4GWI3_9PLEO|nr:hypothetical protein EK21DRAFT_95045 [Setomelanomma holmii]
MDTGSISSQDSTLTYVVPEYSYTMPASHHLPTSHRRTKQPESYVPKSEMLHHPSPTTQPSNHPQNTAAATNQALANMLGNIEKELAASRSIMLNMESRLSLLEQRIGTGTASAASKDLLASEKREENRIASRAPTTRSWWDVYETFLDSCDTPLNAHDPQGRPKHFSGFQFDFERHGEQPTSPPVIPDIRDVPDLTPSSERARSTKASPASGGHSTGYCTKPATVSPSARNDVIIDDIVEHVVAVDRMLLPRPPLLQSPPPSRKSPNTITGVGDDLTALPAMPSRPATPQVAQNRNRYFKGVRSMFQRLSPKAKHCFSRGTHLTV